MLPGVRFGLCIVHFRLTFKRNVGIYLYDRSKYMKRFAPFLTLLVLATVFVVACEDSQLPTQNELESPSLAIWDGTNQEVEDPGNPDFFFLPPIVANPDTAREYEEGEFNAYLAPKVRICLLEVLA